MAATNPVNLTLDLAAWHHEGTHFPDPQRACRRKRCETNPCFDQRLSPKVLCEKRVCCGCGFCSGGPAGRWRSPRGQIIETLTTATDPPFIFAYNPLDMDMLFIRQRRIVEPILTRLWRNSTAGCWIPPHSGPGVGALRVCVSVPPSVLLVSGDGLAPRLCADACARVEAKRPSVQARAARRSRTAGSSAASPRRPRRRTPPPPARPPARRRYCRSTRCTTSRRTRPR